MFCLLLSMDFGSVNGCRRLACGLLVFSLEMWFGSSLGRNCQPQLQVVCYWDSCVNSYPCQLGHWKSVLLGFWAFLVELPSAMLYLSLEIRQEGYYLANGLLLIESYLRILSYSIRYHHTERQRSVIEL